ncbi:MAG TPA: flagellar brake protein, partial [Synergistales bacterium]|nr:flagellar brake protein [Synergistales bacterium]
MDSGEFLAMLKDCIGSKVSLVIDAGLYKGTYPSRVEDVDEEAIGLAHPMMRGALLPVHRNVQLKMSVEAGGALYFSVVSITKGLVRDSLPLLWVVPVGEARKIQ